jgi:hypothetical protein
MLNSSFSNEKIIQNISQTTNILSFQRLFRDPKLELTIHFESNLPWALAWDVASNSLTGSCTITVFPKLVINGELYEDPCKHDLVMPMDGFAGLEAALLSALKDSLKTAQRVWD